MFVLLIHNKKVVLSKERITELVQSGKLSASVPVSEDGKNWTAWSVYLNGDSNDAELEFAKDQFWENENGKLPIQPDDATFLRSSQEKIWFYSVDGASKEGPLAQNDLANLIKRGILNQETIVWKEGQSLSFFLKNHPVFSQYLSSDHPVASSDKKSDGSFFSKLNEYLDALRRLFQKK